MIALAAGEPEGALFEVRVATVPQGEGQAQALLVVADAAQAVFAPAVGAGAGLVIVEVVPGVAVWAVVLAHGAPGTFGEIGAP